MEWWWKALLKAVSTDLRKPWVTFISVDGVRALVTMGALALFDEAHKTVLPNFRKDVYKEAIVSEGEEGMILRPEEQGTQQLLVHTSKIQKERW